MPKGPGESRRRRSGKHSEVATSAPPGDHPVFTVDDLVAYLRLPKSTVYKLAQEGKIPGQKVGRHWRFRREAIDRWLDEGRAKSLRGEPG
ncbi:MAG: DNA-binding protein [Bacteroidetes bacterium]|nr:MAG: DNA-binding protein [Bacteroidota bacterium]